MSRHHLFNPDGMPPASGFSYGALADDGRLLHIAGLTGHISDESIADSIVEQFAEACRSVARVIEEAGGAPTDLVLMTIYSSAMDEYKSNLKEIGHRYREVFGRHYPPMALLGISELFDPKAKVELVCVAIVPEED